MLECFIAGDTCTFCERAKNDKSYTYDLVGEIRRQRLTFTGHVLRYGEERLTRRVLLAYFSRFRGPLEYPEGSILEDAPKHRNLEELIVLANDRKRWQEEVGRIEGKRHSLGLKRLVGN